jgi:hypothetical protein
MTTAAPHPPMSRLVAFVRARPVLSFFVLAYALAWAGLPFGSFFAPGALVAALIVALLRDGWAGLRAIGARLIRWRVGWIWYAVALAVPLSVHAATIGLNVAAGAPAPDTAQFSPWFGVALAIGMNMVNPTGGPFGEEPSFRGFAQPILQTRHTPLAATAILAALITGWHAPLFFIDSFGLAPIEAVTTVAVTFWYAWLFNQAAGSALITLLAHATEGSINTEDLWPAGADGTRETWLYVAVWSAVAVALLVGYRHFWGGAAAENARDHGPSAARKPVAAGSARGQGR